MDKIIKIFFLIVVFYSCNNKNKTDIKNSKIIFIYQKDIIVDFEKKEISLEYEGFTSSAKFMLSRKEDSIINNSFKKNRIEELRGKIAIQDSRPSLIPRFENTIYLYTNDELKTTITVKSNQNVSLKTPSIDSYEYRIFSFHDDLREIIEKNQGFVRVLNSLVRNKKTK